MRIIAGRLRSRKLASPPGTEVRPTSDRLRETLFNVLAQRCDEAVWLDLFAGTGAVGIEAISRGARQVYFVESEKKAARLIRDNLAALEISDGFEVQEREVASAIRLLDAQAIAADVIFLDPPYSHHGAYEQVLGFLSQSEMVGAATIVVAEHEKRFDPGEKLGSLERYRLLKQGDASLSFYRRRT